MSLLLDCLRPSAAIECLDFSSSPIASFAVSSSRQSPQNQPHLKHLCLGQSFWWRKVSLLRGCLPDAWTACISQGLVPYKLLLSFAGTETTCHAATAQTSGIEIALSVKISIFSICYSSQLCNSPATPPQLQALRIYLSSAGAFLPEWNFCFSRFWKWKLSEKMLFMVTKNSL